MHNVDSNIRPLSPNSDPIELAKTDAAKPSFKSELTALVIAALSGGILGLSSPGFDQWYLAWCTVAVLFVCIFSSSLKRQAFFRAFMFGASYTFVYGLFLLTLNPAFAWSGPQYTTVTAYFWWLVCGIHQGTVFGVFALLARQIPITCNLIPEQVAIGENGKTRWHLPAMFVLPLLWVVIFNKLGNLPYFLAFPWTMLEYSQYKNVEFLQIASIIGGIGLGALIVMANSALFTVVVTFSKRFKTTVVPYKNKVSAIASLSFVAILVAAVFAYGNSALKQASKPPSRGIVASMIQGNMCGKADGSSNIQIVAKYLDMSSKAPRGLCLWTEWVFPMQLRRGDRTVEGLLTLAKLQGQSWLIGALETDGEGKTYNTVCALSDEGQLMEPTYKKRFLVPFHERLPDWVTKTELRRVINTIAPGNVDLSPGDKPNVIKLRDASVGSLICLEVVSPELVCDTVRDGAEILADLSNTSWYQSTVAGQQMVAFSVIRAVETSRTVLFSTTRGPSAIIDPNGRIIKNSEPGTATTLSAIVPVRKDITPFVRWFR